MLVNGAPVALTYQLRDGDRVQVYPIADALGAGDAAGGVGTSRQVRFAVDEVAPAWPEDSFRARGWVSVDQAVQMVELFGLKECLCLLPAWLDTHPSP